MCFLIFSEFLFGIFQNTDAGVNAQDGQQVMILFSTGNVAF